MSFMEWAQSQPPDEFTPREGLARREGPETSRDAARAVTLRSGTQRRRILEFLAERGEHGATDYEIESALQIKHAPRRLELENAGFVRDTGRRRPTDTNTSAEVRCITQLGLEALGMVDA